MQSTKHLSYERSDPIRINNVRLKNMKDNLLSDEYSLNHQFFDPSKSSPPNEFMMKLRMRVYSYCTHKKEDNFVTK